MKKLILSILIFFCLNISYAQDANNKQIKTIFGNSKVNGGYGAPIYRFGFINSNSAFINGGRGAWLINHRLAFGGAGYSFSTKIMYDNLNQQNFQLSGGYGGLLIEPILLYKLPIHLTFPVVFGAGGISYVVKDYFNQNYVVDVKPFFVVEPGLELELNMLQFFRMDFGVYYRFTNSPILYDSKDLMLSSVNPNALNDFSVGITLKFGKF